MIIGEMSWQVRRVAMGPPVRCGVCVTRGHSSGSVAGDSDDPGPPIMKRTYADSQIAVYDDVLSPGCLASLQRHLQHMPYERVHAKSQQGVWRIHDGDPLRGPTTAYSAIPASELVGDHDVGALEIGL